MHAYVNTSMGPPGWAVIEPEQADYLVSQSRLIRILAAEQPRLVDGPLDRSEQHWISTGRALVEASTLSRSKFMVPSPTDSPRPSGPNRAVGGLFTSTPSETGRSMWEIYMDARIGSSSRRKPLQVWSLEVGEGAVTEISSVKDWVSFVVTNGFARDGMIYVDWSVAARNVVGVHMTVRAIAAIQGFCFETRDGLIAPEFWDVEQTFWLRWAFRSVALREAKLPLDS
jgi:hypothetical protein